MYLLHIIFCYCMCWCVYAWNAQVIEDYECQLLEKTSQIEDMKKVRLVVNTLKHLILAIYI